LLQDIRGNYAETYPDYKTKIVRLASCKVTQWTLGVRWERSHACVQWLAVVYDVEAHGTSKAAGQEGW